MDYWWYAWLGANGADGNTKLWDENGKSRFNTPEGIAATQFLVDLAQKYKAVNPDFVTAGRDADLQPLFYNSKLAMLETGSWYPTLLKNNAPDLQVGIARHPGGEGRHEARDRVLAGCDHDVQAEQASEGSRQVPRMDVRQGKPPAVRQAARRHPGAHRRGRRSRPTRSATPRSSSSSSSRRPRTPTRRRSPPPSSRSTPRPRTWWPARWPARSRPKRR